MGFFINAIGQHSNVANVSYVFDRVFNADWVAVAVAQLKEASMSDDKQAVAAHLAQVKSKSVRRYA